MGSATLVDQRWDSRVFWSLFIIILRSGSEGFRYSGLLPVSPIVSQGCVEGAVDTHGTYGRSSAPLYPFFGAHAPYYVFGTAGQR